MRAPFSGVLTGPVPQAPPQPSTLGRNFAHRRAPVVDKAGREEVFFKRDLLDHGLPHCDARRPSAGVPISEVRHTLQLRLERTSESKGH